MFLLHPCGKTLSKVFRSIYGLKATDVIGPSDIVKQHYDILLVDEAHRLHQYKNIVNRASFKANCKALGLTTESDELEYGLCNSAIAQFCFMIKCRWLAHLELI